MEIKGNADLTYNYRLESCVYTKTYNCKHCKTEFIFTTDIEEDFVKRLGYNIVTEYIEETYDVGYCKSCKQLINRRNKILKIKDRI